MDKKFLQMLLNEYQQEVEQIPDYNTPPFEIGTVIEIPTYTVPNVLIIIKSDNEYSDVIPMSYLYELASEADIVINFEHPLRDKWIVQIDMIISVPNKVLYSCGKEVGKIKGKDLGILQDAYLYYELPENRCGKLSVEDELVKKFKRIEARRHRWLVKGLFKDIILQED